ncbi:G-protein-signaling modulator 2 isoform X2 [Nilaparvata lugens]|uniref:G-protein-signaling modulator 2 isoform X2 n=1 Tax=Nilaparvata lugens TaxID=108931 RepID=UPI00193DE486|nr:G-protein-signaling modulator 2 isoform X2 [Nilaparvata lugens]
MTLQNVDIAEDPLNPIPDNTSNKMSLSASAENVAADNQSCGGSGGGDGGGSMCLELALEGERLCKAGDCRAGVAFFQAAIQAGTDDLRILSAIYSQLGNAYFYLGDYAKAMQYHKHDLTLARTMGDKLGEAKSSGNLGNTLKVMGKFDEAMICCKRHLEISRELNDKLSEGRALYNLGNVYHAKGKHIGRVGQQDPGEFPEDVRACLQQAVKYYEENLQLMRELNDTAAQGRACGNLGNTYYLLGNFQQAIHYHQERLKIAREFGDKAAERRANSNLGNSHIFLGEFETAAEHYKRTLTLAQELGDRAVEAQACYSLGNTYTLLRDYPIAIEYHLRHMIIAQQLLDRVGEGRACWSLGNAHSAMGNHEKALYFAMKHLEISKELGDPMGQATAQMNVSDLRKALGMPGDQLSPDSQQLMASFCHPSPAPTLRRYRLTPDGKARNGVANEPAPSPEKPKIDHCGDDEDTFFDVLSRFQSERMDDQRCSLALPSDNKQNANPVLPPSVHVNNGEVQEDLLDLIVGMQSKRMDEQRVELPHLPGLCPPGGGVTGAGAAGAQGGFATPDEGFLELLVRCQGARLEDQRSLPPQPDKESTLDSPPSLSPATGTGATVPDEDFFSLIMRLQSGRMEDQRATVPAPPPQRRHNN